MCGGQNLSKYYYNQLKSMIDNDVEELKNNYGKLEDGVNKNLENMVSRFQAQG